MTPKVRALIYARVSTSHHNQNPEIQIYELRRYCEARHFDIVHEIVDHGHSGGTDNRPGLRVLFELARSHQVNTIIVTKLDRLFRSLKHLVITLEEFERLGIQFVAVKDNVDWTTPAGRFFVQVLGSLAELEKSILRERTISGLEHARRSGKRLGRPRANRESEIVRLKGEGLSDRQIRARLNVSKGSIYRALRAAPKTPGKPSTKTSIKSGQSDE